MAQTKALIVTLKSALKANGKTYLDVSKTLNLSEASVKRLFSDENISLARLDKICQLINIEISDLVLLMNEGENNRFLSQLQWEQEQEIAEDNILLLVTVTVLNRWSMAEILNMYNIDEHTLIRKLAILDRIKIIELLPKNKIKLLIATNFSWIKNGPIQKFFLEKIQADFFNSRFEQDSEKLIVLNGMLSKSSDTVFQKKMNKLAQEFDELSLNDTPLKMGERQARTVILAIRPWAYEAFNEVI